MSVKKGTLGMGLNALLPVGHENTTAACDFFYCDIENILANPYQPRSEFDDVALAELTESIKERGIIQPLIVRRDNDSNSSKLLLVAGERRLRAARDAGLRKVPVVVRTSDGGTQTLLEDALIENIQRQNLNPLEEAKAYQRLLDDFGLTQEDVAKKTGKNRSTIANVLRLLQLPLYIQEDVLKGILTAGHARALVGISDKNEILRDFRNEIVNKGLSVRDTERESEKIKNNINNSENSAQRRKKERNKALSDAYCRTMCVNLEKKFGNKAKIIQQGTRGKIEIEYYSTEDFERLVDLISSEKV